MDLLEETSGAGTMMLAMNAGAVPLWAWRGG